MYVREAAARLLNTFISLELITLRQAYEVFLSVVRRRFLAEHIDQALVQLLGLVGLILGLTEEFIYVKELDCTAHLNIPTPSSRFEKKNGE